MIPNEHEPADMIKTILQKIIDEMETLESDRIMPDERRPKDVKVEIEAGLPEPAMIAEEPEDENLDPGVLDELMAKAGEADDTGALPEDDISDLPPEINDAVRRKRKVV